MRPWTAGEYIEALETIKTASKRMERLVDRLLKLSRLEVGKGSLFTISLPLGSF